MPWQSVQLNITVVQGTNQSAMITAGDFQDVFVVIASRTGDVTAAASYSGSCENRFGDRSEGSEGLVKSDNS